MAADFYKYLPRSMKAMYESTAVLDAPAVFQPLPKPIEQCTVALLTSAGVYLTDTQEPFDLDGERKKPTWGDPTYREIPSDVDQSRIGHAHLHINGADILEDVNIALPFRAFKTLEAEGAIGALAPVAYSFMGFQENNAKSWDEVQGPELGAKLKERVVDVLLLAPA
jgi:D-proline reductase (dithiol) PrdB